MHRALPIGLLVASLGSPAAAATYYVSTAGSDANDGTSPDRAWRSLGEVNGANLAPGDEVLLRAGDTWTVTDNAGRLRAQTGVTYSRYGSGPNPLIDGGGVAPTYWKGLIEINGETDVIVDAIDVTGSGVFGVMSSDSSRVLICNLKADYTLGSGVVSIRGTDVTIDNVEVAHVLSHPHESITISGTDGFVLSNSYIHDGAFAGLDMKSNARNGVVFGNEVTRSNNDPTFYFERCENIEAFGNLIHTTPEAGTHKSLVSIGVEPLGDEATRYNRNINFHHNTVLNGHGYGIKIWIKEGIAETGPDQRIQHGIHIHHNTVVTTNTEGTAWQPTVIAVDNRANPDPSDWGGIVIEDNIFWDNGPSPGINIKDGISATVRNNLYETGETGELGVDPILTADVGFVDPSGGDFSLQPGSPAVGAGHDGSDVGRHSIADDIPPAAPGGLSVD